MMREEAIRIRSFLWLVPLLVLHACGSSPEPQRVPIPRHDVRFEWLGVRWNIFDGRVPEPEPDWWTRVLGIEGRQVGPQLPRELATVPWYLPIMCGLTTTGRLRCTRRFLFPRSESEAEVAVDLRTWAGPILVDHEELGGPGFGEIQGRIAEVALASYPGHFKDRARLLGIVRTEDDRLWVLSFPVNNSETYVIAPRLFGDHVLAEVRVDPLTVEGVHLRGSQLLAVPAMKWYHEDDEIAPPLCWRPLSQDSEPSEQNGLWCSDGGNFRQPRGLLGQRWTDWGMLSRDPVSLIYTDGTPWLQVERYAYAATVEVLSRSCIRDRERGRLWCLVYPGKVLRSEAGGWWVSESYPPQWWQYPVSGATPLLMGDPILALPLQEISGPTLPPWDDLDPGRPLTIGCFVAGGRLSCWGENGYGRLGIGEVAPTYYVPFSTPVTVLDQGVVGLNVSYHWRTRGPATLCAWSEGGDVWCWGTFDWGFTDIGKRLAGGDRDFCDYKPIYVAEPEYQGNWRGVRQVVPTGLSPYPLPVSMYLLEVADPSYCLLLAEGEVECRGRYHWLP